MPAKVIKNRMEVMCACGNWGRMIDLDDFDADGKQLVRFVCGCDTPTPNWEQPFKQPILK